jgi:hypothetical protein
MSLLSEIQNYARAVPAEIKESKGVFELTATIAERKAFLSTQKLQYLAKFRIHDDEKLIRYFEILKESGAGMSGGSDYDSSSGFGFKTESYKTGGTGREGTIEQQSILFGKKYEYRFDFKTVRTKVEELAKDGGYRFELLLLPKNL